MAQAGSATPAFPNDRVNYHGYFLMTHLHFPLSLLFNRGETCKQQMSLSAPVALMPEHTHVKLSVHVWNAAHVNQDKTTRR